MTRSMQTDTPDTAAAAFLIEARPGDALEAMLVEQMAAVHEAAQRCLARAAEVSADHPQIEALYLRQAARLLHLFARQAEALDRRRIAAEDRAESRERSERFAESDWQEECRRARLEGKRPPGRPTRRGAAWPAWAVRGEGRQAQVQGAKGAVARGGGRSNGAAPPA